MPNWIQNKLYIVGTPAELDRFAAQAIPAAPGVTSVPAGVLSFGRFIPEPRRFPRTYPTGRQYLPKCIRWRLVNWGTKWEAYNTTVLRVSRRRLRYTFATAWQPPVPWLKTASRRFPSLTFSLHAFDYDDPRKSYYARAGKWYRRQGRKLVRTRVSWEVYCLA